MSKTQTTTLDPDSRQGQREALLRRDMADFDETKLDDEVLPAGDWKFRASFARLDGLEDGDNVTENTPLFTASVGLIPVEPVANYEANEVEGGEWRGGRYSHKEFVYGQKQMNALKALVKAFGVNPEGRDIADSLEIIKNKYAIATVGKATRKIQGENRTVNRFSNFRPVA